MAESLEVHSREIIDKQLVAAGWTVAPASEKDSLGASHPVALCEEKLHLGRADYVLYVEGKACGVIEAKREQQSL